MLILWAGLLLAVPASAADSYQPETPRAQDAPIALLVDLSSGQTLFAREADRRFMPASITKSMTALTAFEWMAEGRISPNQKFAIRPETFEKWHGVGSTMFLPRNARLTVEELLRGIMTVSANGATVVLAEGAAGSVAEWTGAMNALARSLGMSDSHFNTPNGWMDGGKTFTTARDLVKLAKAMTSKYPNMYRHFIGQQELAFNGIAQRNHDPNIGVVSGADGIKTGFTDQSGYGYLGSAVRSGRRLVMVVAGCPSAGTRARVSRSLMEWGFASFESLPLFAQGQQVGKARVQNGGREALALIAPHPIRITQKKDGTSKVSLSVRYEGPLRAPIAKGERVARLVIEVEGLAPHSVPLVAARSVQKAGIFSRIASAFEGWFA